MSRAGASPSPNGTSRIAPDAGDRRHGGQDQRLHRDAEAGAIDT